MKNIVMISLFLATQAFAIIAPRGEFAALSCVSTSANRPKFSLVVLKNTENKSVKLAIGNKTHVARELTSTSIGSPVVYVAEFIGGEWRLSYNATTAPSPRGRKATFSSEMRGHARVFEMICNRVNY